MTGEVLKLSLRAVTRGERPFWLRSYQRAAVEAFYAAGSVRGGSGVIVMPCGAGKTIIGMGVMEKLGAATLVITTSTSATRQWIDELLDKTTIDEEMVGEYSGHSKQVRPIT